MKLSAHGSAGMPFVATLCLFASATASAQSDVTDTLDTVVVAASRSNMTVAESPQTVLIIDKAQIQQQLTISSNSSDVLANLIPSYTPSRGKMNGSGETLRGRTPLILIDGVPQSNPIRPTGREAHTIDYSMVERIEVIQGANAINGLGATGGTINIITRRPRDGELNQHVDVQATAPTAQTRAETTSVETRYRVDGRTDKLDYLFSASYSDQGLYVDGQGRPIGADNTQGDLMTSKSYDVLAKLGYALTDAQRLSVSVNRYRIKNDNDYIGIAGNRTQGLPTTSVRGTPQGTAPWNDVLTSSLSYSHDDLAGMQLSAMVFNQEFEGLFGADNSSTFQDPRIAPVGTLYDQSRSVASKWGSKVSLTKDDLLDSRIKLTGGIDLLADTGKQDLYGTGRTYVPESDYRNLSLFVQGEYKLLPTLTLHAGIRREEAELKIDSYQSLWRYNRVDVEGGTLDFNQTLYNAGLVYTPVEGVSFFTSYSEGFGMPDVGRVLRAINTPGTRVASLSTLEPILTKSVEAGTRLTRGAFDADLSYFQSNSDLGTRVVPINGAFMMSREKTRVQGVDASLGYRLDAAHRLRLAYAYTRGRYDSDNDGQLDARLDGLNVAPNRVIASWSAQWTPKLSSFVQAQHAFSQSFDEADKRFSGYTLVDATFNYSLPRGALRMGVSNLFDKQYITYYSQSALVEPLRYFAGRGRTLTLGYSLDF
ncbi:TonB-dependent receptor [Xanthomonas vesicatoria]|nr:TonB-dependent receptor [Xanthomonas vesicatoria]MCC8558892.1 TonB-dependent receptor [Xanthomonas vesicatoria]MCC8596497.1 TonB-dependent receptor [Xanthomonas vesicatoria]MCC8601987.1 TonB-dependent receptor [Xanthomonas vesicatoria]MCC8607228.1 TonB-dependent receptor [Xanthomonas vesicatoria]MCC8610615.1 TonB-dependent receptor [Xanthomonas vesicatoria]